ncbi:MAG: bifunctional isocitrate dehydrogenase kinase/phosphatase [Hyphomicrobiaceae bacterium]|nr:bifunctional isocitrate dehydrogenase kinase/phosphatase [Hyphomicrobiaceae bacterium]
MGMDSAVLRDRLSTEQITYAALGELDATRERDERARIIAKIVYWVFEDYYQRSRHIPLEVKAAFEARDWPTTFRASRLRLSIYSQTISKLAPVLDAGCPELKADDTFWGDVEAHYLELIRDKYEADIAFAFIHSVRRKIYADDWRPVEYAPTSGPLRRPPPAEPVTVTFVETLPVKAETVRKILEVPRLKAFWRDVEEDAELTAQALTRVIESWGGMAGDEVRFVMVHAGFYRNRGCYLVGRIAVPGRGIHPLTIALLNEVKGIFVDAVLTESDDLQYVFSSTLANLHVTCSSYHELAQFLFSLMPKRPLGLHYSTIGFNHIGKVAVINEIVREQRRMGERFNTAVGFRGTVAIGFSMPSSKYVLKIIRDTPTSGYKWGTFDGVPAVLEKYRFVHNADRAGSMLDNIIYYNIALQREAFADELVDELIEAAHTNVKLVGDNIFFRHLIVQPKMIPLPVFLETAGPEEARLAVINLGYCIKNNAAANVFNKDLDGRNYGVSPIRKVYLFDYDAVEPLTSVKVRTNEGREDGEEDVPDWFFEDGTIFLPEEMMVGLRIDDRDLRRVFQEYHPELTSIDYWQGMQRALEKGYVPKVRSYPIGRRLRRTVRMASGV